MKRSLSFYLVLVSIIISSTRFAIAADKSYFAIPASDRYKFVAALPLADGSALLLDKLSLQRIRHTPKRRATVIRPAYFFARKSNSIFTQEAVGVSLRNKAFVVDGIPACMERSSAFRSFPEPRTLPLAETNLVKMSATRYLALNGSHETGSSQRPTNENFQSAKNGQLENWQSVPPSRWTHFRGNAIQLDHSKVLLCGGLTESYAKTAEAEVLDLSTMHWCAVAPMSEPRLDFDLIKDNGNKVVVVGGLNGKERPLDVTEIFDPATKSFQPGPRLRIARSSVSCAVLLDGTILVLGGYIKNDDDDSLPVYTVEVLIGGST